MSSSSAPNQLNPFPIAESLPQIQGYESVVSRSGHLVLQEVTATTFSVDGVDFSTNGHRTPLTSRLVPDVKPYVVTAETIVHTVEPKAAVVNNISFGSGRSEVSDLHVPDSPPAHKMNARLLIPKWMNVDHDGKAIVAKKAPERRFSMGVILDEAREHYDDMAKKYPCYPINKEKAIDSTLRNSDSLPRPENIDPDDIAARQIAGIPSTVDPVDLFAKVIRGYRTTLTSNTSGEKLPSVEPIVKLLQKNLDHGFGPLGAHYRATIDVLVQLWEYRDNVANQAIQSGNATIQYERNYLSALLEHRKVIGETVSRHTVDIGGKLHDSVPAYSHY